MNKINELYNCPYLDAKKRITGVINAPGSKSYTNRYLVLKYLSYISSIKYNKPQKQIILNNALDSRDSKLMENALDLLKNSNDGDLISIDVGLAGTVMRFLPCLAALRKGNTIFDGDEGAKVRPMGPILYAMEQLGIQIIRQNGDFLPFTVVGTGIVEGGSVEIDASSSSQFISGLLLAGALFEKGVSITHTGERLPSTPHIDMTIKCLNDANVLVEKREVDGKLNWSVQSGHLELPQTVKIEADLSNLMVFASSVLANPSGGDVIVKNWDSESIQPGIQFVEILKLMGAKCEQNGSDLIISSNGLITGIDIDLSECGEITPTVAALCAIAQGDSYLRGIGHLRGHETDRLSAIVREINKLQRNARIDKNNEGIIIDDFDISNLKPAIFESYNDHRMATFAALIGLKVKGCSVNNIETTSKTMPNFVTVWEKLIYNK